MPTFCRHNRLIQNCTICAREQNIEARPVVSSSAPRTTQARERAPREPREPREPVARERKLRERQPGAGGVKVRRLARGAEDGYRSPLVPGLKSSEDAERLAQEIAFAVRRLDAIVAVASGEEVPGADPAWSEIAAPGDIEARTLNAFHSVLHGPRGLRSGNRLEETLAAFETWAARAGSFEAAFTGEPSWTPERRFERIFERLGGVAGMTRDIRFELLELLGHLGVYELAAGKLQLTGENEATWAAKRALGIGDPLLLERRAADLAQRCGVPLDALDLGFHNWGSGARAGVGLAPETAVDEPALERARAALGL